MRSNNNYLEEFEAKEDRAGAVGGRGRVRASAERANLLILPQGVECRVELYHTLEMLKGSRCEHRKEDREREVTRAFLVRSLRPALIGVARDHFYNEQHRSSLLERGAVRVRRVQPPSSGESSCPAFVPASPERGLKLLK